MDVALLRGADREAERVIDDSLFDDLVVSNQAGKDRQPSGVGRRPPVRPQGIAAEVEDRAGTGVPTVGVRIAARTGRPRPVELVKLAALESEHEDVPVAGTIRAAFDRWIVG